MSKLKPLFLESVKACVGEHNEVAIALSGGKDSTAILFAILELGITPKCYTFHIDGVFSSDYKFAQNTCKKLDIEFTECVIPKEINKKLLLDLIVNYDRINKVDVECYYPYFYLLPKVKEKVLLIGVAAGIMVPLSKKACIHFRKNKDKLNKWREHDFANITSRDLVCLNKMGKTYDVQVKDPFYDRAILNWFKEQEWDDLHKPSQKQVLIDMFPDEFADINTMKQCSLQCGDSGIRDIYTPLLDSKLNYKKRTRVIDLYRDIYEKNRHSELI